MTLLKWKNHNIKDVEMNLLLSAFKQRYGYDFTGYARASLKRRLLELTRYYQLKNLSGLLSVPLYIAVDDSDQAMVRTIIAMAQSLKLDVIVEGVETEEQFSLLQQAGCEHYQGYLFSKPVPIAEFEALLQKESPASLALDPYS